MFRLDRRPTEVAASVGHFVYRSKSLMRFFSSLGSIHRHITLAIYPQKCIVSLFYGYYSIILIYRVIEIPDAL